MKKIGGKVIASGGFGCVFRPALKCVGETTRANNKISKLMSVKHAEEEFEEINSIKKKLNKLHNFENYFLLNDVTLCKPDKLSSSDLVDFTNKCSALPKDNITKQNINQNLDKLMSLNIPNGGLPVDDYLHNDGSFEKIYELHLSLVQLLKKGIAPMNKKYIYHCDIKDSNILVDDSSHQIKTRLIDWGLSTEYKPFENNQFPKSWRNRPLQFNVPFSVILFSDLFIDKYTKYLNDGGKTDYTHLKPFAFDYLKIWMKERGAGHYKYINEIMFTLFSDDFETVSFDDKPRVIETQVTMNYIINYIVEVLVYFTKFKDDGSLNLRDYLDNVFIQIVDIWGFLSVYFPIVELLSNNLSVLNKNELKLFEMLKYLFIEYMFNPRHKQINMNIFYSDLKYLGNLIQQNFNQHKIKTTLFNRTTTTSIKANKKFKKTKKNVKNHVNSKTKVSFLRKQKHKRFKNPFLISLK
jgi:serine/threonine protein kinase